MVTMAATPTDDVLLATHVTPAMREAVRAEAKQRNVPMSRLLREMLEERFGVKERPRNARVYSKDIPKMDQTALDLDVVEPDEDEPEAA